MMFLSRGVGVLPIRPMGRLRPKGLQGYKRVVISLVEIYEKLRKSVISVCGKKVQKG